MPLPSRIGLWTTVSSQSRNASALGRTLVDEVLEVLDADRDDVEPVHTGQSRALECSEGCLVVLLLDEPRNVVRLVARLGDDNVLRRDDVEALAGRSGAEAVVAALEAVVVTEADRVGRELLAVSRDDAQLGAAAGLAPLLIAVLGRLVVERVLGHVRENEVRVSVRRDARNHAVDLEDGRDLDEELRRREPDAELPALAFALLDDGDLDEVGPRNEKRVIVLPVQRALEQVRSRAVVRAADVGDPLRRGRVVDPDALRVSPSVRTRCGRRNAGDRQRRSPRR